MDAFEIEIVTSDPDTVVAWIREHFATAVTDIIAHEIGQTERWRCTIFGRDATVATAIKLYWHNQEA